MAGGKLQETCHLPPATCLTCNLLSANLWRRFRSDREQEDAENDGGQDNGHKQDLHHDLRSARLEALADLIRHWLMLPRLPPTRKILVILPEMRRCRSARTINVG